MDVHEKNRQAIESAFGFVDKLFILSVIFLVFLAIYQAIYWSGYGLVALYRWLMNKPKKIKAPIPTFNVWR